MRDVNRIKPLLQELEKLWLKKPDLRFWQIVEYVSKSTGKKDPFYIEDDVTERLLKLLTSMGEH
jgi:uncharacterized protein YihD (DUF1040 family)